MKTVKITVLAIFAIALLTGVSQLKETETGTNESSNHEVNQPKIKLTALIDIKVKDVPGQG